MIKPFWKILKPFSIKLNTYLLYNSAIAPLGIYPREMKIFVHTRFYKKMFIAALLIIDKY